MNIAVTQSNGYFRRTDQHVGSAAERQYYRVMTEKHGKLFFDSEGDYHAWASSGDRRQGAGATAAKHRGKRAGGNQPRRMRPSGPSGPSGPRGPRNGGGGPSVVPVHYGHQAASSPPSSPPPS
jgi:hypothetical protein